MNTLECIVPGGMSYALSVPGSLDHYVHIIVHVALRQGSRQAYRQQDSSKFQHITFLDVNVMGVAAIWNLLDICFLPTTS